VANYRRVARFGLAFDFAAGLAAAFATFLALTAFAGFATFAAVAAGLDDFAGAAAGRDAAGVACFAAAGAGAGTAGAATGRGGCGGAGVRELDVLSGGSGCLRGRPLLRAACPSAMSLSNAAFASARSRACCELRTVNARSFSARKRSSGLRCVIGVVGNMPYLNRPSENGFKSSHALPSSTSWAAISPMALANLKPWPEQGLRTSTRPPSSQSMMKWWSGVFV